jgi:TonB-linked SusC/RagA family outer membrane protein
MDFMIHGFRVSIPGNPNWLKTPLLARQAKLMMKLTTIFMLAALLQLSAKSKAQNVTLSESNVSLQTIFKQINKQTGYQFFYEDDLLSKAGKVSVKVTNVPLNTALEACFRGIPLQFEVINKTIVIRQQPAKIETSQPPPPPINIRGVVRSDKGEILAGISIVVKNTQQGTVSDAKGLFAIDVPSPSAILVFSGTDLETQEIPLNGRTALIVTMVTRMSPLDEVQITGYGKTTRRYKTSAVSTLRADDIAKQPVTNPIQAMQGRMAGVSVTQTAGAIGAGVEIQIRGINTIESGNQPLIIVDGAILPDPNRGLGTAIGGYMSFGSTTMNNINPADIESIDVLKDADATAIYGSRGANGVVLITTKKGKLGATKFNMDVSTWANSATYLPKRLELDQFKTMRRQAFAMGNHNPVTGVAINPITRTAANSPDLLVWDTTKATEDWQEYEFGNPASAVNVQGTLSGGDKRLNFYASGGYQRQRDITRGSPFQQRISGTMGVNHTSQNNKFQANLNASYVSTILEPSRGSGSAGAISGLPPNMPMFNPDGTSYWPNPAISQSSLLVNPVAAEESQTRNVSNSLVANVDLSYQIVKGLTFKTQVGFNKQDNTSKSITPSTSINPLSPGSTVPSSAETSSTFQSVNIEPQLTYTGKISKGKIELLAGSTFFDRKTTSYRISFNGYSTDLLLNSWAAASSVSGYQNGASFYRFNSAFGRANYNWDGKYIANITYRRDGSSRFGPKNQWADFGAVGGAWIFTKEKWMKSILPGLTFGKLRSSYGTAGNDNIADYRWVSLYTSSLYDGRSGLGASFLSDSTIGWENSRKLDFGMDLGFLNDRILFSVNWYRSRTSNLLLSMPVPAQTGFTTFITNTDAVVENKGWEFEVTTQNLGINKKWSWRTTFNLSTLKNQLLEFPDLENSAYANRLRIGYPINSPRNLLNAEWSQVYEGVDTATGLPKFQDLDKNGIINNNDRTYIGSAIPRLFGGLGNTIAYKGFELDVFLQFSQQLSTNWLFNNTYPGQLNNPAAGDWWGNYWTRPGDIAKYPRLFSGTANSTTAQLSSIFPTSSAGLQDVLYVRFKNLSLSYTLPLEWVSKAKMSKAMVYLRGQNLLTWTSNKLYKDPELIQLRSGQVLRTITAGLQLTF